MQRLPEIGRHAASSRRAAQGFTLIELMVSMTIAATLAAIAYPSYQTHVTRTHRDAAKACLSQHAQFMERYYTTNLTYVGANPALGCSTESNMNERYTFVTNDPAATASTFTVTAAPVGVQTTRDTKCGTLSLTQDGSRGASGTGGVAGCW